jgi:Tfp pilus assembly protein PilE
MVLSYSVKRKVFSLVELLIVICILAILMTLLMPSLQRVAHKATVTECALNFKGLGLATFYYTQDNHEFYLHWTDFPDTDGRSAGRTSYNSLHNLGRGSVLKDMMLPYYNNSSEEYWNTHICPDVDRDNIWPTTHIGHANHPEGIRAPAYYTQKMPILQYFTIYGFRGLPTTMYKLGDTWNWGDGPGRVAGEQNWSRGPSAAIDYDYNIIASDRVQKVGPWGRYTVMNHNPPGFDGEVYEQGYSHQELSAGYTYEANYLFDDGSVRFYDDIEYDPGENSEFLKFHRGSYVPVDGGKPYE